VTTPLLLFVVDLFDDKSYNELSNMLIFQDVVDRLQAFDFGGVTTARGCKGSIVFRIVAKFSLRLSIYTVTHELLHLA